jgi:hypothetical protein
MEGTLRPYLEMSDAQLYGELATEFVRGHAVPPDSEQREALGARYFAEVLPRIRAVVCGSPVTESIVDDDDHLAIASAVAELIAGHFKFPPAVFSISVLVARMGLRKLCHEAER